MGRPRKNRERYADGHLKKIDQRAVVAAARQKHYGVSVGDAKTDLAGFALGRLALRGLLGANWRPVIDAAASYVQAVARYMRVKYPSYPLPKAFDYLAVKGLGGEPQIDEVQNIVHRYERYRVLLAGVDGISRMKFHSIVFDDIDPRDLTDVKAVIKCVDAIMAGVAKKRNT